MARLTVVVLAAAALTVAGCGGTASTSPTPTPPPGTVTERFQGTLSAGDPPCAGRTDACVAYAFTLTTVPGSIAADLTYESAGAFDPTSLYLLVTEEAGGLYEYGSTVGNNHVHFDSRLSRPGRYLVIVQAGLVVSHRTSYTLTVNHSM